MLVVISWDVGNSNCNSVIRNALITVISRAAVARVVRDWAREEPRGIARFSATTSRGSPSPPSAAWPGGAVSRGSPASSTRKPPWTSSTPSRGRDVPSTASVARKKLLELLMDYSETNCNCHCCNFILSCFRLSLLSTTVASSIHSRCRSS